jgi:hypothetical protein
MSRSVRWKNPKKKRKRAEKKGKTFATPPDREGSVMILSAKDGGTSDIPIWAEQDPLPPPPSRSYLPLLPSSSHPFSNFNSSSTSSSCFFFSSFSPIYLLPPARPSTWCSHLEEPSWLA